MEREDSPGVRERGELRPLALEVAADVGAPGDPVRALATVHVHVRGGRAPVRLHFRVDGRLLAVQSGTGLTWEIPAACVAPGVHTLTVHADDAHGSRAETSMRLALPPSALAACPAPPPSPAPRGTRGLRRLLARVRG